MRPWRDYARYGHPGPDTFYQCQFGVVLPGTGTYGYRPEREGYFSYAMNSCLELDANAWQPEDYAGPPMPSFLDTGKILRPAEVITLFDQLLDPTQGFDGNVLYREAGKYCGSYPKAFSARHGRAARSPAGTSSTPTDTSSVRTASGSHTGMWIWRSRRVMTKTGIRIRIGATADPATT